VRLEPRQGKLNREEAKGAKGSKDGLKPGLRGWGAADGRSGSPIRPYNILLPTANGPRSGLYHPRNQRQQQAAGDDAAQLPGGVGAHGVHQDEVVEVRFLRHLG